MVTTNSPNKSRDSVVLKVRLPADVRDALAAIAADYLRSMHGQMVWALRQHVADKTTDDTAVYIGHSSIKTTFDVYGHLLPGDEATAAVQLDALLDGIGARQSRDSSGPAVGRFIVAARGRESRI